MKTISETIFSFVSTLLGDRQAGKAKWEKLIGLLFVLGAVVVLSACFRADRNERQRLAQEEHFRKLAARLPEDMRFENVPLSSALEEISKASGLDIKPWKDEGDRMVTVDVSGMTVTEALKAVVAYVDGEGAVLIKLWWGFPRATGQNWLWGYPSTRTPAPTVMPTPTPKPMPVIENRLTPAERLAIFNTVWQTVNDNYFDPTFGGKNWQAIGDEYRQKLAAVQDDSAFWLKVLNPMLFELGVSHLAALPPELATQIDVMTFASGSLGFDLRLLNGKPVITQIIKGSPADEAGLRPGFIINAVDGWTLNDITALGLQTPPANESNRRGNAVQGLRGFLYGETGKQVVVEYLDENNRPKSVTLQFAARSGSACGQIDPSLPPACAEVETRRLADGSTYLRFSGFLEPALDRTLQAINDLHDAPGLIIDLRGNPGGQFFVRKAIASQLVGEPKLFIRYQHRDGLEEAYLDPVPNAYQGKVVILVDELSASSSEEFAGSLQALGRATIVGSQTPGRCLTMNVVPLPNGALLVYPFGQSQTPDGRVLENNGVVPDIEVALDGEQLLQGIDTQLEAAIEYLAAHTQ